MSGFVAKNTGLDCVPFLFGGLGSHSTSKSLAIKSVETSRLLRHLLSTSGIKRCVIISKRVRICVYDFFPKARCAWSNSSSKVCMPFLSSTIGFQYETAPFRVSPLVLQVMHHTRLNSRGRWKQGPWGEVVQMWKLESCKMPNQTKEDSKTLWRK